MLDRFHVEFNGSVSKAETVQRDGTAFALGKTIAQLTAVKDRLAAADVKGGNPAAPAKKTVAKKAAAKKRAARKTA